ncbi:hypothetical protein [Polycladidibacter hongkongensis]|uniref:hypothetical protein n=1 Tax=Polycladidibacter hongkongensis TaxID=1647556 RepID=UPI00082D7955|nr:hypothetical protein [Pseudovibrio hongkongensis]
MVSVPGLIGAALGLVLGLLNRAILLGRVKMRSEALAQHSPEKLARWQQSLPALRLAIFVLTLIGFPIVGYLAAAQMAGG